MRIALVSFYNTTPFLEGLRTQLPAGFAELLLMPPSGCAEALRNGSADLALIPVAALPDCTGVEILKGFCIASEGPVDSVLILSKVPLEEITELMPDAQSRTSNLLAQLLLKKYWKRDVKMLHTCASELSDITGKRAAVVIGDRAFHARKQFPYSYDLASAWKALTGLPMVFAVWAYHPERVSQEQLDVIQTALSAGVRSAEYTARMQAEAFGYTQEEAVHYICRDLLLTLDARGEEAVDFFLKNT